MIYGNQFSLNKHISLIDKKISSNTQSYDQFLQIIAIIIKLQMKETSDMNSLNIPALQIIINQMKENEKFQSIMCSLSQKFFLKYENQIPEEILQLAKQISFKMRNDIDEDPIKRLQQNSKVWRFREHRLFTWISVWMFNQILLDLNYLNQQFVNKIHSIFWTKSISFLHYELLTVFQNNQRRCCWRKMEREKLRSIMNEYLISSKKDIDQVRWKLISFKLYSQSNDQFYFTSRQCRQQWINHLSPILNKDKWTFQEDYALLEMTGMYGNRWSFISEKIKNRSEHMIKNRYKSLINKWCKKNKKNIFLEKDHIRLMKVLKQKIVRQKYHLQQKEIGQLQQNNNQDSKIQIENCTQPSLDYSGVKTRHMLKLIKQPNTDEILNQKEPVNSMSYETKAQIYGLEFPYINCIVDEEWFINLQEKNTLQWLEQ